MENPVTKGIAFEQKIVDKLNKLGFKAHRTNKANEDDLETYKKGFDGGVDIIARYTVYDIIPKTFTFYIQCKNQERDLTKSAISEVYAGMKHRNPQGNNHYPVVIHKNRASEETIQFAKDLGVELFTEAQLELVKQLTRKDGVLYAPFRPFAKVLLYAQTKDRIWIDTLPDNDNRLEELSTAKQLMKRSESEFNRIEAKLEQSAEFDNQFLELVRDKIDSDEAYSLIINSMSNKKNAVDLLKVLVYRHIKATETVLKCQKEKEIKEKEQAVVEKDKLEQVLLRFVADSLGYGDFLKGLDKLDKIQKKILFERLYNDLNSGNIEKIEYKHTTKVSVQLEPRETADFPKAEIHCCVHCGSISIIKYGKTTKGVQRYRCKDCSSTFSENYGLITHYSHLSEWQWIEIVRGIVNELSLTDISKNINVSVATAWLARTKIYATIKGIYGNGDDSFNSIVEADEKYERLSFKGVKSKHFFIDTLGRLPRHHRSRADRKDYLIKAERYEKLFKNNPRLLKEMLFSSQKKMVGRDTIDISHQHVSIMTAIDRENRIFLKPIATGNITSADVYDSLHKVLENEAILVTDDHHSYKLLCRKDQIEHEIIKPKTYRKGAFTLSRVNNIHSELERFLPKDRKPATKYIDLYLSMFWYFQKNKDISKNELTYKLYDLITGCIDPTIRISLEQITEMSLRNRPYPIDTKGFF